MVSSALNRLAPIDFTRYIDRLTERFTGREWLFEQIDRWLKQGNEQFYLLTGEPGVGKSAIAAKLTQIRSDIAAYHFCRAGDVETVRPGRVLRSLAAQLGKTLPHYGEALAKTIDPIRLRIDVNINIESLSNSQVTGIYIENLKESDPRDELEILLRAPLAALPDLYAEHNEPQPTLKVLLIDSLDEAVTTTGRDNMTTLLAALSQADGLPSWIRFILTARPDLRVLQQFELMKLYKLEELLAQNLQDIERYVGARVEELVVQPESEFQARLEQAQLSAETLVREVKELSKGNFLYTRLLIDGIGTGELSVKNLSILPKTLNEVYQRFLRHRCPFRKWSDHYQSILGTLTVTQEAVTQERLVKFTGVDSKQVQDAINILKQFLDEVEDEQGQKLYTIFHQSLREYLLDKKHNHDFWCDAQEEHERVVEFYRNSAKSWNEVKWNGIDIYGLKHLAKHVYSQVNLAIENQLRKETERYRQDLYELICQPFMQAKFIWSGSHQFFAEDVELALNVADAEEIPNFIQLIRGYYLSARLGSLSTSLPPEVLGGLAQIGKVAKAGGYAALISDASQRNEAYNLISEGLLQQKESNDSAREFLEQAVIAAEQATGEDKVIALSNTALNLAKANEQAKAEKIFEQAVAVAKQIGGKNGIELLSRIAQMQAKIGYFDQALAIAAQIDDPRSRATTLSAIALSLAQKEAQISKQNYKLESQNGWLDKLSATFRRIFRLKSVTPVPEPREGGDGKDLQLPQIKASEIFEQAISTATQRPDVENLAIEPYEYMEYSATEREMKIMREQMLLMMDVNKEMLKQSVVQIKIAQDLVKAGELENAEKLLQQAVSIKILDFWYEIEILIQVALTIALWGNHAGAAKIFKQVEAKVEGLGTYNNGGVEVLVRIVQALLATGQLGEAAVVARKIDDPYKKSLLLSEIGQAKAQANEPKQAVEIFEQAVAVANQIYDSQSRENALNVIIKNLAIAKHFDRAVALADQVKDNKQKVIALGTIAQVLAQARSYEKAAAVLDQSIAVAEQIENSPNKPIDMGRIAQILTEVGKQDRARAIFTSALSLVEQIGHDRNKAVAWSAVAQSLAQVEQYDRAESVAAKIEELDGQGVLLLKALEAIIHTQLDAKQFHRAKTLAEEIWVKERRAGVLSRIARFLQEVGQAKEARELFDQAIALADYITCEESKLEALGMVARSLTEAGQQAEAARLFDRAIAVAEQIKLADSQAKGLSKVALALAEAGQQTKASEIFNRAINIFQRIGKDYLANDLIDIPKKLEVLSVMVQDLAQAGEHIKAAEIFKEALPGAVKFLNRDLNYKSIYIGRLVWAAWNAVKSLILIAQFDEAMTIAVQTEQIAGNRGKAKVLDGIAQALVQTQQFDRAIEVVAQIRDPQDRMETLVKVAHLFEEQGTHPLSSTDLQSLFKMARTIGSESVFGVLAGVASHLANIDQGQTLWEAYDEVTKVEGWWRN